MIKAVNVVAALAVVLSAAPSIRAALTASEAEQVRNNVATAANVARVRALVARPDLTGDEASAAMINALEPTPIDDLHLSFLRELVFGLASVASRPVLAAATVSGLLARTDAVIAQHPIDLDRAPAALAEMQRAYAFTEEVARSESTRTNTPASAVADVARAVADHIARHASVIGPQAAAAPSVARARAQVAIALLDLMPAGVMRRLDAADKLALTGVRRALLVQSGILWLDTGGADARMEPLRLLLDHLPGARQGVEAVFIGADRPPLVARDGSVIAIVDPPAGPLSETSSPWAGEADAPPVEARTMAAARALAAVAVLRALERRPELGAQAERDGGPDAVATMTAMLAVDAQRTMEVVAARWLAGRRESVARLADAVGALAVFATSPSARDGLSALVGNANAAGLDTARLTQVALAPTGAASAFRLDAHSWRIDRDGDGAVVGMRRDGVSVTTGMLAGSGARPVSAKSWSGGGLVFARLSGSPRVTISDGPRVRLVGAGAIDAIATPAPGDDVTLEADLRVAGGPAGAVVRALPTAHGFQGVSVVVVPGATPRALLLVADGRGVETAAAPAVDLVDAPSQHVRVAVHGNNVDATVGTATLACILPDGFAHGDFALRASPGASLEVTRWHVSTP